MAAQEPKIIRDLRFGKVSKKRRCYYQVASFHVKYALLSYVVECAPEAIQNYRCLSC